jgi:hypothetical protein
MKGPPQKREGAGILSSDETSESALCFFTRAWFNCRRTTAKVLWVGSAVVLTFRERFGAGGDGDSTSSTLQLNSSPRRRLRQEKWPKPSNSTHMRYHF